MNSQNSNMLPCDCCQDSADLERGNRPGLSQINYRLGTHGSFLEQLLADISRLQHPAGASLRALKSRDPDDPSIALLDAWAVIADVLTFYQERIANEGFLRTATERRSVLELARAIGYELNPGVAASVYLVFTVEDAAQSPCRVTIAKGTQVQNIPGQGQLPQTFETSAEIETRAEWNVLRPRLTQPQKLTIDDQQRLCWVSLDGSKVVTNRIILQGLNTGLKPGELMLVSVRVGNKLKAKVLPIQTVTPEPERQQTIVDFGAVTQFPLSPVLQPRLVYAPVTALPTAFTLEHIEREVGEKNWRAADLNAFLNINQWVDNDLLHHLHMRPVQPPAPIEPDEGVFSFRTHLGFFGNNAPAWASLPVNQRFGEKVWKDQNVLGWKAGAYNKDWDSGGWEIWKPYPNNNNNEQYYKANGSSGADVYLERTVPEITPKSWVVLEEKSGNGQPDYIPYIVREVNEKTVTGFSLSSRVTGLALTQTDSNLLSNTDTDKKKRFSIRTTTAHVQSQRQILKELPIESPLQTNCTNEVRGQELIGIKEIMLDRLVLGLVSGQPVAIQGEQAGSYSSGVIQREIAFLKEITHKEGYTHLEFTAPLQYRYIRQTVSLNANVVLATHGETMIEVLGSGDGAQANQTFKLKKLPLTHIAADTPSGAASSLEVRVNGIRWSPVSAFCKEPATAEVYTVRIEDDGTTGVIFGNGQQGARIPTGSENVTAVYRSGIGATGEVAADSISLLKQRPLGIRSVTNPRAPSGAEDPETLANARQNAPLTVYTLDRIVSLQDYESFARAFAGIGKAQAVSLWDGSIDRVHITIASASGQSLSPTDRAYTNLKSAIENQRDISRPFLVDSFLPQYFSLKARLRLNAHFEKDAVLEQVNHTLLTAFSFDQRQFGQGVSAAEVVTQMQQVRGVISVDLDEFHRVTDQSKRNKLSLDSYLKSAVASWNYASRQSTGAELLLIDPNSIALEVIDHG
jgi:predicted phage baseplate assembly protein